MIRENILVIDDSNPDCQQFLDIFKETNCQVDAPRPSIIPVEIILFSYKDYKNIFKLLGHLNVRNITRFFKSRNDDETNADLLNLRQMITKKNRVPRTPNPTLSSCALSKDSMMYEKY